MLGLDPPAGRSFVETPSVVGPSAGEGRGRSAPRWRLRPAGGSSPAMTRGWAALYGPGHQHVVLAPDLEHLEPVARAIDRLAVVQAEHIVVPATADHSA